MHVIALEVIKITIHSYQDVQVVTSQWDKALTKISAKYQDFANIFSLNLVMKFFKNNNINKNVIQPVDKK